MHKHLRQICLLGTVGILTAAAAVHAAGKMAYAEELIPRLNIPHVTTPPTIDGRIQPEEWRESAKVMGMVNTSSLTYRDRPVSFWVGWDAQHLYIGARSDILTGHRLYRNARETFTTNVVFDDSYEFGLFMHDRNKKDGEVSSFLKFIINSLGAGEYMKIYPSIGQNMYNWQPNMKIANALYEADGKQWWDLEIAMNLEDMQMPVPNKTGDLVDLLLAGDLKNPGWQWLDFPSASGHLEQYGFPRLTLTQDQPYLQVERIAGLHDEKLDLKTLLYNPGAQPATVQVTCDITYNPPPNSTETKHAVVEEKQTVTIPASGSARFDLERAFPGLKYEITKWGAAVNSSRLQFTVKNGDALVYSYTCDFAGTDKNYLKAEPRLTELEAGIKYNPASNQLELSGDTLDAKIPASSKPAALTYAVDKDGAPVKSGRITQFANLIYTDIVDLPVLVPGKYRVTLALVDATDKVLVSRNDLTFEKKDAAKEFAAWWNNKIADTAKVLPPFEALKVKGDTVTCTRRSYQLDALGLPRQIEANGGKVLTAPARIVVTVAGKEVTVPTKGKVHFTERQDWRLDFTGKAEAAGLKFDVTGSMEQDGLVNLNLTFAPQAQPVAIDDLRVEWPVDDAFGSWMSCIGGVGGNYAPRTIGKVPDGQGEVWNTLDGIGKAGSTMLVGNWESNLWIGNDQRGLCWFGDSDQGWVPNDKTPAHSLMRDGKAVILRNHLIRLPAGDKPFMLAAPRTVNLQYNATPFRHFAKGWRLTQVSAANGFSRPDYKTNEKTKQEYFSILSMPTTDVKEWPDYYAKYKERAAGAAANGWYGIGPRLTWFLCNQIALRGYMDKTTEPGLYGYFGADWMPGDESLNKSYRDYMINLMNRHVREGGLTHYYFDISFTRNAANLAGGFGYRLPDGRVQPSSMDPTLREWYKRVWALMAENNLYPGGVSGHATHSISLRALPWTDAILDSEYPMKDPITVYTKDAMIAMSCPENFGVNISHLGFMRPDWASLHDAAAGGSGFPFNSEPFRHFGISADDVQFLSYWRNQAVLKPVDAGVLASAWKRPGKAIIQVLNYGLDPEGQEKSRSAKLTLDLKALGVPAGVKPGQLRVREISPDNGRFPRHCANLPWFQALPEASRWKNDEQPKLRPPATPTLDAATGVLDGVELFYHDSRYLLITWDEKAAPADKWAGVFEGEQLTDALTWGLNHAGTTALSVAEVAAQAQLAAPLQVQVWKQPGTVMLRIANPGAKAADATLALDLDKLGVKVQKLWTQYTQCLGGTLDAPAGKVTVKAIPPGKAALVFIDTF